MNGTEENLISLVSEMNISDTQLILTELVLKNLPPVFLLKRKSNFAGFYGSKAFLVRNNGVDMKLYFDESLNAVVFASEFQKTLKPIRYLKHSTGRRLRRQRYCDRLVFLFLKY